MLESTRSDRLERLNPIQVLGGFPPPLITVGSNSLGILVQVALVVWSNVRSGSTVLSLESRGRRVDVVGLWDRVGQTSNVGMNLLRHDGRFESDAKAEVKGYTRARKGKGGGGGRWSGGGSYIRRAIGLQGGVPHISIITQ